MQTINYISIITIGLLILGCNEKDNDMLTKKDYKKMEHKPPIDCVIDLIENNNIVNIEFVFKNITDKKIFIRERLIFAEKNPTSVARCLNIIRDNKDVPYTGPMIFPISDEYYEFLPKTKLKQILKLNDYFDISQPGKYSVVYSALSFPKDSLDPNNSFTIISNEVEFAVK